MGRSNGSGCVAQVKCIIMRITTLTPDIHHAPGFKPDLGLAGGNCGHVQVDVVRTIYS
ncbi:hypothetical protein PAXINDRAFT_167100 [Paxillus involutus ATCC 200175]|nr:hypothetical protein PAXINDRAFT_167100 [Paxillus involutus ATCC 200175]